MRTGELYQRYYGLYLATVVDVNDPEKLGRVRLKMDQFEDSDDEPVWASVSRPAGGKDTSVFFTPKLEDQVIVGFLVGDVNEPVIMGYAHSNKQPKAEQVDTKKHGIVTSVGRVIFNEEAKTIEVTFAAGGKESVIKMSDEGIEITAPRITMKADTVCVNEQAVVLKGFIDGTFANHVHPSAMGPTAPPSRLPASIPVDNTIC